MTQSVAFITDAPRIAGSEIWLRDTLPMLAELGFEVTLHLPAHESLRPLIEHLEAHSVGVRPYHHLSEPAASTQSADLRILQAWFPQTYQNLVGRLKRPWWVFVHDQLEYNYPLGLRRVFRSIYAATKARHLRKADGVLVGTRWAARHLWQHFRVRATAIPLGVDLDRFHPAEDSRRAHLREKFGLTRFTLINPSRFTLEKNQWAIVQTARLVPEADFLLVGSGDARRLLERYVQRSGITNVRFLGHRTDIAQLYQAADAVIFPTLGDNPGLVILEGMASGLPVIASNFPPQAEVLTAEEGLLVAPRPHHLAKAVRALITSPSLAKSMGMRGRLRAEQNHDLRQSVMALAKVLHEVK